MAKKDKVKEEHVLNELEKVSESVEIKDEIKVEDVVDESLLNEESKSEESAETELKEEVKTIPKRNNKRTVEVEFLEDSIYFKKGDKSFTSSLNAQQLVNLKKAKIV